MLQHCQKAEPYSQIALIYDHLMRHVNYREWSLYLQRLFTRAGITVNQVLDMSSGTGSLALNLSELGFRVCGFDASAAMVGIAKKKLGREGRHKIPLWVASMRRFSLLRPCHAAVCTYDSLNYCLDLDACVSVFNAVAEVLSPGGVFVFDVSTVRNSRQNFYDYYDRERTAGFKYIRQSYYLPSESKQVNEFFITHLAEPGLTYHERHVQRIYPLREILSAIPPDLFEVVGMFDGFTTRPATERAERAHFLLKKR